MAHIVEFKITGLAGRKDIYIQKLNRDINVFFGDNGTGKTSLLRILRSAMSNDASTIRTVPFKSAEVVIHSVHYGRDFVKTIHKPKEIGTKTKPIKPDSKIVRYEDNAIYQEYFFDKEEEKFQWAIKPSRPDLARTNWMHIYLPTYRLYASYDIYSSDRHRRLTPSMDREYDWDLFFAERLKMLWSDCSNQLLSEVRKIQEQGLANILRGIVAPTKSIRKIAKKLDSESAYHRVAAFLARQGSPEALGSLEEFTKKYEEDLQVRRVIVDINTIEQRIDKERASRDKLKKLISDMFGNNKIVEFKDTGVEVKTKEGHDISLALLSSGEKHALWIFIETLLVRDNTLLIDEPEISMHIDWQKRLISAMNQLNKNAQLIIATHSPEIMSDLPDNNIFHL